MSDEDLGEVYSRPQAVIGVTFFLLPLKKGKINLLRLKEKLEGRVNIEDVFESVVEKDVEEGEELYIPDVFMEKDSKKLLLKTSVDKIVLTPSSLFGKATIDKLTSLGYRGYRIVIINTIDIHFLILEDKKTGKHYLIILGSRSNSRNLLGRLNKFLEKIGLYAVEAKLDPERIDEIRGALKGELIDTTLVFAGPKIHTKRIMGKDFQDDPSYLRDASESEVKQHMFQFRSGLKGSPKVITLSEDALVRFYSLTTFKDYEWFLRQRIFPYLRQGKKLPQPPITGFYAPDDIFEEENEEEE